MTSKTDAVIRSAREALAVFELQRLGMDDLISRAECHRKLKNALEALDKEELHGLPGRL